jgi:hypothetical protein
LATALKAVASHVYADCGHDVLALDVTPDTTPELRQLTKSMFRLPPEHTRDLH